MRHNHLFGLVALLMLAALGALAVFPARWLALALPAGLPLRLSDAQGTVWSGQARVTVGRPGFARTVLEPLHWRVGMGAGPYLTVQHAWLEGPVSVRPAWSGIHVSGQTLRLPAALLSTFDARLAAFQPAGQLELTWPTLILGAQAPVAGTPLLQAQWRDAASALSPVRPLGQYRLTLSANAAQGADMLLATDHGPVLLQGSGTLGGDGQIRVNATVQVDPSAQANVHASLDDMLAALGPRRAGVTALRFP